MFCKSRSRTTDDGGGERADREGPDGGAPRKGDSCALEEHCPAGMGAMPTDRAWRRGSLEVEVEPEVSLMPLRPVV